MAKWDALSGRFEFLAKLKDLDEDVIAGTLAGLNLIHEEIMTVAKERCPVAPVRGGTLRSSGRVLPAYIEKGQIISRGGFGGAAEAYAVVQHERLDYKHTTGQAKFYESAMLERSSDLGVKLVEATKAQERAFRRSNTRTILFRSRQRP